MNAKGLYREIEDLKDLLASIEENGEDHVGETAAIKAVSKDALFFVLLRFLVDSYAEDQSMTKDWFTQRGLDFHTFLNDIEAIWKAH